MADDKEKPNEGGDKVAVKEKGTLGKLSDLLEQFKDQIASALPNHLTPERMIRVALTAVSKSPLLQKCDPRTIAGCIVQSSLLGLECDGALGEGYLVPFWNRKAMNNRGGYECQFMPGYQGILKLVRNTGELVMIDTHAVYDKDEFDYAYGFEPTLVHKPAKGMRGQIVGYWAGATLKGGGKQFVYWTKEEIDDHRDKYSKGAYKTERGQFVKDSDGNKILQGPWADSPDWMYKKTVLRQLAKLLPKSAQAQLAIALDEAHNAGIAQRFQVEVPLDLQPTPTDEDEAEIANRVAAATAASGADLREKLTRKDGDGEAVAETATTASKGSTKKGSKKKVKDAPESSGDNQEPEQPTNQPDETQAAGEQQDGAPDEFPPFKGDASQKNMSDMPSNDELRAIYDLAKKKGVVPSKVAKQLYGINTDELGKAAAAHFKGYLGSLPDKQ